jgi:peptidoglycan/LPS O-acetylase OafA/YrhL
MHKSVPYRKDIESLRGIAVLSVLFFHYNVFNLHGGFIGVDIFFVLSGYLITLIILNEKESFSYLKFYERRVRRLLPAFYLMLAVVAFSCYIILLPYDLKITGISIASSSFFLSNLWFFKSTGGYFDIPSSNLPLLHTWSLAIEEQYYLLYPGFIILLHRSFSKRNIFKILLCLLIVSLLVSQLTLNHNHNFSFYLTPSRAWELLLGGLFALDFLPTPQKKYVINFFPFLGLVLITVAIINFSESTTFPGINALLPCIGTALILFASPEKAVVNRYLSNMIIMRLFGKISYSLYLWHWPIFVLAQYYLMRNMNNKEKWVCIFISLIMAFFSFKYIETPFQKKISRRHFFILLISFFLLMLTIGISFYLSQGFPQRMNKDILQILTTDTQDINPLREKCHNLSPTALKKHKFCVIGTSNIHNPKFAVVGDSHVDALISGIDAAAKKAKLSGIVLSYGTCVPFIGVQRVNSEAPCKSFMKEAYSLILNNSKIKTVFLIALWGQYAKGTTAGTTQKSFYRDAQTSQISLNENKYVFERGFEKTVNILLKHGKQIVIVAGVPEQPYDIPRMLSLSLYLNKTAKPALTLTEYAKRQRFMNTLFERWESTRKITVIHPESILCDHSRCLMSKNNHPLYYDSHHLSRTGSRYIEPIYYPVFSKLNSSIFTSHPPGENA